MKYQAYQERQRTLKQNNSLHKLFQEIADLLNEHGLDIPTVLAKSADVPWSKENVKLLLWKPLLKKQLVKSSTTEHTTVDINDVYDTLNRFLAENFSVSLPEFPHDEHGL